MSNITSKIRGAIGALGILALASPLAAQTRPYRGQMRYAAQWVDRSQAVARSPMRWRGAAEWRVGWVARPYYARPHYAAGWGWRAYGVGRPMMRRAVVVRYGRPPYAWHRGPWIRARAGWRYYRR